MGTRIWLGLFGCAGLAFAFGQSDDLVGFGNGELFDGAAGPVDLYVMDGGGVAEAEVDAGVVG